MTNDQPINDRLLELYAANQLGELTSEEHAELEALLQEHGEELPDLIGELLVMFDATAEVDESVPTDLNDRLVASGRAAIAASSQSLPKLTEPRVASSTPARIQNTRSALWPTITSIAAMLAIGAFWFGYSNLSARKAADQAYTQRVAEMQEQIDTNASIIASSRVAAERDAERIQSLEADARDSAIALASAKEESLNLAARLADATSSLQDAELVIARYEKPEDPARLAQLRRQLLTVPDTVQIAWQPFDLPDSPAEQQGVRGDVVWSDELQEGYIRFEGLAVNDPSTEQYQVWVIDERGLEQKVSGGVFNASADGEVIVPITPGIDVGRVALFAITVENPGGTWVPDLSRRVVVAPREDG